MNTFKLEELPLSKDIETKRVLRKLNKSHRALAELKGLVSSIPNENILINTPLLSPIVNYLMKTDI